MISCHENFSDNIDVYVPFDTRYKKITIEIIHVITERSVDKRILNKCTFWLNPLFWLEISGHEVI